MSPAGIAIAADAKVAIVILAKEYPNALNNCPDFIVSIKSERTLAGDGTNTGFT